MMEYWSTFLDSKNVRLMSKSDIHSAWLCRLSAKPPLQLRRDKSRPVAIAGIPTYMKDKKQQEVGNNSISISQYELESHFDMKVPIYRHQYSLELDH